MKKFLLEVWDFVKVNFKWLLVAGAFLFLFSKGCFNSVLPQKPTSDTATHTVQTLQPIIVNPTYQPQQVGKTVYVPIPTTNQPVTPAADIAGLTAQVVELNKKIEELANDYYAIKHYKDSITLKDSGGKRVGVVNLDQTVSENTLKSTQPSYQLYFPVTTTTITNTAFSKLKNKVYIGVGVESYIQNPGINQVNLGLLLQNKHEVILGISGTYNFPLKSPGVLLTLNKKISLHR